MKKVNDVRRPSDFESAVKDKEAAKENIKVSYIKMIFTSFSLINKCKINIRSLKTNDQNT